MISNRFSHSDKKYKQCRFVMKVEDCLQLICCIRNKGHKGLHEMAQTVFMRTGLTLRRIN